MMKSVPEILADMRKYASLNKVPVISREGEAVLTDLVKKHRPASILEIGTAIGYSSVLMAACLPDSSKIITIEKNPARIERAKEFFGAINAQIQLIEGDAGEVIPRLNCFFDLVFIDAAKGQYLDYLGKTIPKLAQNAVVVADNVLFRGIVLQKGNDNADIPRRFRTIAKRLRAYLDFVNSDPRFTTIVHETGDGIAVSYYNC